jgi:hypothetical protein
MKRAILILALVLAGCDASEGGDLTYDELVKYPTSCAKAEIQLEQLHSIQTARNFNPDPDLLTDEERAYNSRLKATIWWYAYKCGKS